MVEQTFYIKKDRLTELKSFIRLYLPTTRFKQNPYVFGNDWCIMLSMEVQDSNKLNELFNKWYDLDNYKSPKKSFWKRMINVFALSSVLSIFDNDAHNIVSKKGEEIMKNI